MNYGRCTKELLNPTRLLPIASHKIVATSFRTSCACSLLLAKRPTKGVKQSRFSNLEQNFFQLARCVTFTISHCVIAFLEKHTR